jgi:hypothetical protein
MLARGYPQRRPDRYLLHRRHGGRFRLVRQSTKGAARLPENMSGYGIEKFSARSLAMNMKSPLFSLNWT